TEDLLTSSLEGFHVKPFQSLENEEDFQTLEEHFFSRLQERPNKSNHAFYSLKTLKGYYLTIKGRHSLPLFQRWMRSGIMLNGKCLTQKTLEYRKTENVSSLSDILEENVDEKYYLSEKTIQRLMSYKDNKFLSIHSKPDTTQQVTEVTLLKVNSMKKG